MADELFSKRLPVVVKSADREERFVNFSCLTKEVKIQIPITCFHRAGQIIELCSQLAIAVGAK